MQWLEMASVFVSKFLFLGEKWLLSFNKNECKYTCKWASLGSKAYGYKTSPTSTQKDGPTVRSGLGIKTPRRTYEEMEDRMNITWLLNIVFSLAITMYRWVSKLYTLSVHTGQMCRNPGNINKPINLFALANGKCAQASPVPSEGSQALSDFQLAGQ